MLAYYGRPDTSAPVQLLEVEGQKLGALVLLAEGRDKFSESHGRLFSILKEPFAIALSNALKHQEVFKLKDLLADDNRYLHQELFRLSGDELVGADFGLKRIMNMVRRVLEIANGRVHGKGGAAELLGINPSTLRYRMNRLGIPYGRKLTQ